MHRADRIGVIELARPKKFNALCTSLLEGIEAAVDSLEGDERVRAILVRAEGRNFCTGADLDEIREARADRESLARFLAVGHSAFRRLEQSPLPVVASVQGLCLAGGLELVLACDVVFAAQSARLGDQHARFGLVPGWGGSQRLPIAIGPRRALDLLFSARWLSADEALDWGLVNFVVEDAALDASALDYCRDLAARNPDGLALMKSLARAATGSELDAGLRREREAAVDALRSDRVDEGLAAFAEHRDPDFD